MPKRPAKKIKPTTNTTHSPSPSQLRRQAKHAAQLEREANNLTVSTPWEKAKAKRAARRKPLQEAYARRMEKASNYKSKLTPNDNILKGTLTKAERANNRRVIEQLVEDVEKKYAAR